MNRLTHVEHGFGPLFNEDSEVLILGSFPSVLSRGAAFFYGNPRNRFWDVLAASFGEAQLDTIEDKIAFCKRHKIALYDAIESCDIIGSKDDSIENVIPANIPQILCKTCIKRVILNGNAASKYYRKHNPDYPDIEVVTLPSTSPANAAWSLEKLLGVWKPVLNK